VLTINGRITDVSLDLRTGLSTFGKSFSVELSSASNTAVLIPEGLAHGFLALEDSIVLYLVGTGYSPQHDRGVRWDSFGFDWGAENPSLSERDRSHPVFSEYSSPFSKGLK